MSAANPPDTKPRLASDPPPGGLRESGARKGHNSIARPVWLAPRTARVRLRAACRNDSLVKEHPRPRSRLYIHITYSSACQGKIPGKSHHAPGVRAPSAQHGPPLRGDHGTRASPKRSRCGARRTGEPTKRVEPAYPSAGPHGDWPSRRRRAPRVPSWSQVGCVPGRTGILSGGSFGRGGVGVGVGLVGGEEAAPGAFSQPAADDVPAAEAVPDVVVIHG